MDNKYDKSHTHKTYIRETRETKVMQNQKHKYEYDGINVKKIKYVI